MILGNHVQRLSPGLEGQQFTPEQYETRAQFNGSLCSQLRDKPGIHIRLLLADGANCRYQFLGGVGFDHIAADVAP
ncbi:MAG TPA: hypothetical protein VNZ03_10995 [Terriglobales bacterium]|jgi:hypothetical protein|nr:hypothetical protein [Terriglobales bacterium]